MWQKPEAIENTHQITQNKLLNILCYSTWVNGREDCNCKIMTIFVQVFSVYRAFCIILFYSHYNPVIYTAKVILFFTCMDVHACRHTCTCARTHTHTQRISCPSSCNYIMIVQERKSSSIPVLPSFQEHIYPVFSNIIIRYSPMDIHGIIYSIKICIWFHKTNLF